MATQTSQQGIEYSGAPLRIYSYFCPSSGLSEDFIRLNWCIRAELLEIGFAHVLTTPEFLKIRLWRLHFNKPLRQFHAHPSYVTHCVRAQLCLRQVPGLCQQGTALLRKTGASLVNTCQSSRQHCWCADRIHGSLTGSPNQDLRTLNSKGNGRRRDTQTCTNVDAPDEERAEGKHKYDVLDSFNSR